MNGRRSPLAAEHGAEEGRVAAEVEFTVRIMYLHLIAVQAAELVVCNVDEADWSDDVCSGADG